MSAKTSSNNSKSSSKNIILEINNIVKTYKNITRKAVFNAVDWISLKFKKGENVGIIGANGAGKSTLVEIIAGVRVPTKGTLKFNLDKHNDNPSRNVGLQLQSGTFPEGMVVKDILRFYLDVYGTHFSRDEMDQLLTIFQTKDKLNSKAEQLSGGQLQRLNVLLSIMHKPEILILDEISTGLDIESRNEIASFVKDLAEKYNLTLFLISHNMSEIDHLCERLIILENGKVYKDIQISKLKKPLTEFVNDYFDNFSKSKIVSRDQHKESIYQKELSKLIKH